MTQQILKTMTFSVALLLSTASFPAYAIDVGVSVGGAGVDADANVSIGTSGDSSGDSLASVDSDGNPVDGGSQTDIIVNLGSLLDGITIGDGADGADGSGGAAGSGGGGGGGGGFQMLANRLSASDLALLRPRCNQVLADPNIYKPDVVEFCRIIARLPM